MLDRQIASGVFLLLAALQLPAQPPAAPIPTQPRAPTPSYPTQVAGKDLAAWLKELRESPDGYVRETAVKVIPLFGPQAIGPAARPLALQLKAETDPGVRVNIILALAMYGGEKTDDTKLIVDNLNQILIRANRGSPVRLHATRTLTAYGTEASSAVGTLINFNMDEDSAWETRQAVCMALGRISQDPKRGPNPKVLQTLVKRLPLEESATVRLEIAQSLLLLGPPKFNEKIPGDYQRVIKPFLDPVVKRIEVETDAATKIWLRMVQMFYDGTALTDANIARIADGINGTEPGAKIAALRALALLGKNAKPALPAMIGALKWEEPAMLYEAITAVAALKDVAKDALPELERLKANKDEYLKQAATEAHKIISAPPAAAPAPEPPKK